MDNKHTQHVLIKKTSSWNSKKTKEKRTISGKCYNCGRKGHYAKDCRDKETTEQRTCALISAAKGFKQDVCYIDSGAKSHMSNNRKLFETFEQCNEKIFLAADKFITANGKGMAKIEANCEIQLKNVLYAPELQCNFISISKAVANGYTATFNSDGVKIKDSHGYIVINAYKKDDLFVMRQGSYECIYAVNNNGMLWHYRYDHLNFNDLGDMFKKGLVNGINISKQATKNSCRTCLVSKIHVLPFPKSTEKRSEHVLELIHFRRLWPVGGSEYFVNFIDEKTRNIFVYFMKTKDEAFEIKNISTAS